MTGETTSKSGTQEKMRFIIRFYHGSRKPMLIASQRLAPFFPIRPPRLNPSNTNPGRAQKNITRYISLTALAILLGLMFYWQ